MKVTIPIAILSGALLWANQLHALEKWEGTDSFDDNQRWFELSKSGKNGESGRVYNLNNEILFSASIPRGHDDSVGVWAWGNQRSPVSLPADRSWEAKIKVRYPLVAPVSGINKASFAMIVLEYPFRGHKVLGIGGRLLAAYSLPSNSLDATIQVQSALYALLGDGAWLPQDESTVQVQSRTFILILRYNALEQKVEFRVLDADTLQPVYEKESSSNLNSFRTRILGIGMSVEGTAYWPGFSGNLAMDDWSLLSVEPEPINLNSKTSTSKGVPYSVAVTALGMTGAKLAGTVALTVGSASLSLPITGSIDKNGYFALTAKGTGANKGFGCALLYDVATGTYRPNKNTVTAPKQKAIKF
jgi:hypothetical protein